MRTTEIQGRSRVKLPVGKLFPGEVRERETGRFPAFPCGFRRFPTGFSFLNRNEKREPRKPRRFPSGFVTLGGGGGEGPPREGGAGGQRGRRVPPAPPAPLSKGGGPCPAPPPPP